MKYFSQTFIQYCVFFVCFFCTQTQIFAKNQVYFTQKINPNNSEVFYVRASDYEKPDVKTAQVNRVLLQLKPSSDNQNGNAVASIDVVITPNYSSPITKTLSVNYSSDNTILSKEFDVFDFNGFYNEFSVSVSNVIIPEGFDIVLTAEIHLTRYFTFNINDVPSTITHHDDIPGVLTVSWTDMIEAEEYDVEWAWVSNIGSQNDDTLTPQEIIIQEDIFKNNASRVTVNQNSYAIPLIYEKGYLIYRIRAVGVYNENPQLLRYAAWSGNLEKGDYLSSFNSENIYTIVNGHDNRLNWQYTAQYAEEGKRKSVITYYDGSLRNRQAQTRLNSSQETVVTEVIYDAQGRPAIQVLPYPTGQPQISYYPLLHKNELDQVYDYTNFDVDSQDDECSALAQPMSTNYGIAQYYSSNHEQLLDDPFYQYIPDAQGYPFSQVEYTPDNTGRIARQGGVGETFQIGNKDIRYFYETPSQEELVQLFGSEAGIYTHYKKNITVDANGQASISYLDMQGNVIATTMAGATPESFQSLSEEEKEYFTQELLPTTRRQNKRNTSLTFTHIKNVFEESELAFNYEITPAQYTVGCELNPNIVNQCFNCVVNVSFRLIDACGQAWIVEKDTAGEYMVTDIVSLEDMPAVTSVIVVTQGGSSLILPPGTYTVERVLEINMKALDEYTNEYLSNNEDCVSKFDEFLADAEKQFADQLASCSEMNNEIIPKCEAKLRQMLVDVSPFGQYGDIQIEPSADGVTYEAPEEKFPLSVFCDNSHLPRIYENYSLYGDNAELFYNIFGKAPWRFPMHYIYDTSIDDIRDGKYYKNGDEEATIQVYWNKDQEKSTPELFTYHMFCKTFDEDGKCESYLESQTAFVSPKYLKNISDFVSVMEDSWAQSLVVYHPEFESYYICGEYEESYAFDDFLLLLPYNEFVIGESEIGQKINNFIQSPKTVDPFCDISNANQNYIHIAVEKFFRDRENELTLTLYQAAYMLIKCPDYYPGKQPCDNACFSGMTKDDIIREMKEDQIYGQDIFNMFILMYLSRKTERVETLFAKASIQSASYNGCIGDDNFLISKDHFSESSDALKYYNPELDGLFGNTNSNLLNYCQPCNFKTLLMYKEKVPVFPRTREVTGNISDVDMCYDEIDYENIDLDNLGDDNLGDDSAVQVHCPERDQAIIDNLLKETQVALIDQCGQCPITHQMSYFFSAIVNKLSQEGGGGIISNNQIQLSCHPQGMQEYTAAIQSALNLPETDGIHYWEMVSFDNNTFTAKISNGNDSYVTFKKHAEYDIIHNNETKTISVSWQTIQEFCCIEYLEDVSQTKILTQEEFNDNEHTRFKIGAWIRYDNTRYKIYLEGYSDIVINSCDFVFCSQNSIHSEIDLILQSLLMVMPTETPDEEYSLISSLSESTIEISHENYKYIFDILQTSLQLYSVLYSLSPDNNDVWNISLHSIEDNPGVFVIRMLLNDLETPFEIYIKSQDNELFNLSELAGLQYISVEQENPIIEGDINKNLRYLGKTIDNQNNKQYTILSISVPGIDILNCVEYGYKKRP